MSRILLMYPPGKLYQRGEDRAQTNISESTAGSIHACNDLGYASAILDSLGHDTVIRDYQTEKLAFEDVRADILSLRPDIVFISVTNATINKDIELTGRLLQLHEFTVIFKGAVFYNTDTEYLKKLKLGFPCYLIGGESEFIIGPLVESIAGENEDYLSVPGIIRYDGSGFRYTGFGKWNDDLDSIPYPARGKMNNRLYVRPDTGEMMATVNVSRGCPARCIFCLTPIISGQTVRFRSVENVMGEIRECYFKYGIRNFFFRADTFTINFEWASDLCDAIMASELYQKIEFTVNARADTVTEQLLEKLKKAGCFMLAVGFESGSDESLKLMRKGTSVAENIRAADLAKKAGLPLFGFFIIGFPWENMNHINETLSHIMRIDPDFMELHVAMPFYGTELYSMCEKAGTIDKDSWGFDYINPNTKGSAYIPLDELKKIRKKFLIKFYARPSYLRRKLSECVRNPEITSSYFRYGWRLLINVIQKGKN